MVFRLEAHQSLLRIVVTVVGMHHKIATMPGVYLLVPLRIHIQSFEPKVVWALRLGQKFTIVAPKVLREYFFKLEHVEKLNVSIHLRVIVHPRSIHEGELKLRKLGMSHSAEVGDLLVHKNWLSERLVQSSNSFFAIILHLVMQ
mgnify:CR=1 FL=1